MKHLFYTALTLYYLLANVLLCKSETKSALTNTISKPGFKENLGQWKSKSQDEEILFKIECKGAEIWLTEKGLSYFFYHKPLKKDRLLNSDTSDIIYERFDIDLKGTRIIKANISKEEPSSETYRYFYGHCKKGVYGVKQYEKLVIQNVYPGIDWVLYKSEDQSLKYDFILRPKSDLRQICLLFKSLNPIAFDGNAIQLPFDAGTFREEAPISYIKETNEPVKCNFKIQGQVQRKNNGNTFYETEVIFDSNPYDKQQTLIIDPFQQWWGTYFGGSNGSSGVSITNDSLGNIFILGTSDSPDMPLQAYGSLVYFQGTCSGSDCMILKFNSSLQLVWSTYYGGIQSEQPKAIQCDRFGNIFFTGVTVSGDMPTFNPGNNAYYKDTSSSSFEVFIAKFSNNGYYLWGTYFGTSSNDQCSDLCITQNGDVYICGHTNSPNFPLQNPGNNAYFDGTYAAGPLNKDDSFILKFSNAGQLLLSTYLGGTESEASYGVSCDKYGNVYFVGSTNSSNFPTKNPGGTAYFQSTNNAAITGNTNAYIIKLNSSDQLVWSTFVGGSNDAALRDVKCDEFGNVFVCGGTAASDFPTLNPGNGAFYLGNYQSPLILMKFDIQSQLIWSTYFGTFGTGSFLSLTIGKCNEVYFTFCGAPTCQSCPPMQYKNPGAGAYYDTIPGDGVQSGDDIIITAFSNTGALRWCTLFGGRKDDIEMYMTVDDRGDIYYTGQQGSMGYYTSADLQTYINACILNPGNGAYFQPSHNTSQNVSGQYCVIGKFKGPAFESKYITAGCYASNSASIESISGFGPYTFEWSSGSNSDSIANVPAGAYSYSITDKTFGCVSKNTLYLGLPSLSLNIQSSNSQICLGESTKLSAQGANSFSWMPGSALNANSGGTVIASPQTTTQFTITGYNSPTCFKDSTFTITVNPLPILIINRKDTVCSGSKVNFSVTGAKTYSWLPEYLFSDSHKDTVILYPKQNEVCIVMGKDDHNCVDSISFEVKVIPTPTLAVNGPTTICSGNTATLNLSGADTVNWIPKLNSLYMDSIGLVISPLYSSTNFTFTSTNANVCTDTSAYSIIVTPLPELFISIPDSVCHDLNFELKAFGKGAFTWSLPGIIECENCSSSNGRISESGYIFCTLKDDNSCFSRDSVWVNIKNCDPELIIPNIFTPNNDNANDLFKVTGKNFNNFRCDIVNRWGTTLYSFYTMEGSWNGKTPEGKDCADAVYFYIIHLTDFWNKEHIYKGTIQLIR